LRIGIKYCGGCDPQYDRLEAVERIKAGLGDKMEFVSYEDKPISGVLVVAGCPTACVDLEPFENYPVFVLRSKEDCEALIRNPGLLFADESQSMLPHNQAG
jgi:hypothetical protein